MAQHHLAFPGSASLRPSALLAAVRDLVTSMAGSGFRRCFVVNGHGGNVATPNAAFGEVCAEASLAGRAGDVRCTPSNWYQSRALAAFVRETHGDQEGGHATPSEVALAAPHHRGQLRGVPATPAVAPAGHDFQDAAQYRRRFPDGRIGSNPALARSARRADPRARHLRPPRGVAPFHRGLTPGAASAGPLPARNFMSAGGWAVGLVFGPNSARTAAIVTRSGSKRADIM